MRYNYFMAKTTIKNKVRYLRKDETKAEKILWEELRNNNLGIKFRRQHPIDMFVLDFYAPTIKLGIELDGSIHKIKENKEYKCDCGDIKRKESKTCIKCYNLIQRKIIRPSIEILLKEIKELGYSATGKKYGVSDNSIRKWVKNASMV